LYVCINKNDKTMTTQDLKNNREEIINFINQMSYDLKFAMQMAVELASNCDDLDELKAELQQYCKPVKSSKLADMIAKEHEGESYNMMTKNWEKK